jgi:hypothetical protein
MKSHASEKRVGGGVPPSKNLPARAARRATCEYLNRRGQRCRMLSAESGLCTYHARAVSLEESRDREALASEVFAGVSNLASPFGVNCFLANLINEVIQRRIGRRDAVALAYLSQLLLNSVSAMGQLETLKHRGVEFVWDFPSRDSEAAEGEADGQAQAREEGS